jgi:hypothetical protein
LAASIQAKSILVAIHVPKPNTFVRCSAAGGEKIMVERRPGDGFDGSAVRCGFEERLRRAKAPNAEFVVVAAAGEVTAVAAPF